MQASAFLRTAKAEELPSVLLVVGAEAVLRRRVASRIARLLLPEGPKDPGLQRLDGAEVRLAAVLDEAASGSLLAGKRVLVVQNAAALLSSAGEAEVGALERYVESPNPDVVLLFDAESLDKRRLVVKRLMANAESVECDRLRGQDLRNSMIAYARERGYALPPPAAALAEELLGTDLMMIFNALDKVMTYCGERTQIETEDLERSLNVVREPAMWELTNALSVRDAAAALEALGRLLDEGNHPLQVSASIRFRIRTLLTVREMLERDVPTQKIAQEAGLRFRPEQVIRQARLFKLEELRRFNRLLFDLENGIKSAGVDERFLLEDTVYRICRTGGAGSATGRSSK